MEAWERQDVRESAGVAEQRLTFAHVAGFVIVAELQGLVDASGGTAGDCSSEQTWNKSSCTSISSRNAPGLAAGCGLLLTLQAIRYSFTGKYVANKHIMNPSSAWLWWYYAHMEEYQIRPR